MKLLILRPENQPYMLMIHLNIVQTNSPDTVASPFIDLISKDQAECGHNGFFCHSFFGTVMSCDNGGWNSKNPIVINQFRRTI